MTKPQHRRILLYLFIVILVTLTTWLLTQISGTKSLYQKAALIQIGDDQTRVRSILGKPRDSTKTSSGGLGFALMGGYPEWWAYGSSLHDLDFRHPFTRQFPWIFPIKFHFLTPDTNDVAIYFDANGKVARIYIPQNAQ